MARALSAEGVLLPIREEADEGPDEANAATGFARMLRSLDAPECSEPGRCSFRSRWSACGGGRFEPAWIRVERTDGTPVRLVGIGRPDPDPFDTNRSDAEGTACPNPAAPIPEFRRP